MAVGRRSERMGNGELLVLIMGLDAGMSSTKKRPGRRLARTVHLAEDKLSWWLMSLDLSVDRASLVRKKNDKNSTCIVWRVGYRWPV